MNIPHGEKIKEQTILHIKEQSLFSFTELLISLCLPIPLCLYVFCSHIQTTSIGNRNKQKQELKQRISLVIERLKLVLDPLSHAIKNRSVHLQHRGDSEGLV